MLRRGFLRDVDIRGSELLLHGKLTENSNARIKIPAF